MPAPPDPVDDSPAGPGPIRGLLIVLGLAILVEWAVGPGEDALPGTFAVLGAVTTGLVLGVRFVVLTVAGTRRG